MTDKEFAKKYGLEGKGKPVKISKETKEIVKALHRRSQRIIEAGEDYVRTETRKFG